MKEGKLGKVTGLLAAALALGVLLAACSGQAPAPSPTTVTSTAPTSTPTTVRSTAPAPTQTTPAPQPTATPTVAISQGGSVREIKVTLKDNTFPKVTDFTAGETVRLIITNNGSVEHTFEITDVGILWKIPQGKTEAFEWAVPNTPGVYDCGCYLSGDDPKPHERMEGICNILQAKK